MRNLSFFKNKSVFITGHTGFKGAWLAFWLSELGAKVTGYSKPPLYPNSLFERLNLSNRLQHVEGDIRDYEHLKGVMLQAEPEFVFHLAAQALVRKSYLEPQLTFSTNVMGSVNLLEAVRHAESVRSLVYITSDKCYLNKEWHWGYRENDELGGPEPYSASKACAEHAFKSYYLSFFQERSNFGCGSTRAGNVIGGGDASEDRIVPDIIRALEKNQPVTLRNPNATRPWQHVLDPLYGYMLLALRLYQDPSQQNGEAWNFGPTDQSIRTVQNVAEEMIKIWGAGTIKHSDLKNNLHEACLLHLSIDKASHALRWKSKFNFEQTLFLTTDWYRAIYKNQDPLEVTKKQIIEYMKGIHHE